MSEEQEAIALFPKLKSKKAGFKITSPKEPRYNCIAWAAREQHRFWWPTVGAYWPAGIDRKCTKANFIAAFATLGFAPCPDGLYQAGFEKLALYVDTKS